MYFRESFATFVSPISHIDRLMIRIDDPQACCGCSACYAACPHRAIAMKPDAEGFLYPVVDLARCTDCGLCERVCPFLHPSEATTPLRLYAVKNKDEETRRQSSSGGIFTLLARKVLSEGGIVYGARFDGAWDVCHGTAETEEELAALRGSKYVQSRMGDTFRDVRRHLEAGRSVLFTGTSCQVAGLKHFLRRDYPQLLTADCLCHGVPSPKVWRKYLEEVVSSAALDKNGGPETPHITHISFRNKRNGWKRFEMRIEGSLPGESGSHMLVAEPFSHNPYMRGFLSNLYLRPSCYACRAKNGRCGSDFTLGDFWGINKINPSFDDNKGCSLLLVNSERGRELCQPLLDNTDYYAEEDLEKPKPYNGGFCETVRIPRRRNLFFKGLNAEISPSRLVEMAEKYSKHTMRIKVGQARLRQTVRRIFASTSSIPERTP